jgi:hypothetical protein
MHMDISNAINLALALLEDDLDKVLATWLFVVPTPDAITHVSNFMRDPPSLCERTQSLAKSIRNKYPNGIAPPR